MRNVICKLPILLLVVAALLVSGCSSSSKGAGEGDSVSPLFGDGLGENDLNRQREQRFGLGNIPAAEGDGFFRDVHFGYDSSEISGEALQNIEYNVEVLKANPNIKIQLEGHCDERGTAEYNLALGSDRAKAVLDVMASYGISKDRLDIISYGEEVPLDMGHTEAAYARNRRVHFSGYEDNQIR